MIILLSGVNDFAIRQHLDVLVADFLAKHGDHAITRVDGETASPDQLPDLLQGMSLFASARLVIMRGTGKNKPLWDALGIWLERVADEVTLVLVEPAPDKRTKTYRQLQKLGDVKECGELPEPQLLKWVQATAIELDGRIDAAAARYLLQQVGSDQWQLLHELEKLVHYNPTITRKDIDQLVEPNLQASAFELLDSVLGRQASRAANLLGKLKTAEDPYKLLGLLISQIHTLALVVAASGKTAEVIAKEGSVHPFVVRKMQTLGRTTSYQQLRHIINQVATTDDQLKSTGADPWLLLEQCISKIATR